MEAGDSQGNCQRALIWATPQRTILVQATVFLHAPGMQVGLRHLGSRTPDRLAGALRSGGATRHALARGLCERTGWLNARGRPCIQTAAKALPVLAGRPGLALPPPRAAPEAAAAPAVPAGDVPGTPTPLPVLAVSAAGTEPPDGADDLRKLLAFDAVTARPASPA